MEERGYGNTTPSNQGQREGTGLGEGCLLPATPTLLAQGGRVPVAWRPGVTGSGNKRCSGAPVKGSSWQG